MTIQYTPRGVCSRAFTIQVEVSFRFDRIAPVRSPACVFLRTKP